MIAYGKKIAAECKDKRLSAAVERNLALIPNFATQLKILSTIKATTMGQDLSEKEIADGMETLVINAKNLMGSIAGVVKSCDAATVDIQHMRGAREWRRPKNNRTV